MSTSICGVDCDKCELSSMCGGCAATNGRPFGGNCVAAQCCQSKRLEHCCASAPCALREKLIGVCNALCIEGMPPVTELFSLKGSFVNMEYPLSGGQIVKLLDDNKIYLGTQLRKMESERCYGIAADEKYLLICEYGEGGVDPEIVLFKRWNGIADNESPRA